MAYVVIEDSPKLGGVVVQRTRYLADAKSWAVKEAERRKNRDAYWDVHYDEDSSPVLCKVSYNFKTQAVTINENRDEINVGVFYIS